MIEFPIPVEYPTDRTQLFKTMADFKDRDTMKDDRRVQKTKKAISEALLSLLEQKDFSQLTINEIAETANVNRGTVYFHYEDKYDLFDQCLEEKLSLLKEVCSPINMMSSEAELRRCFTSVYQFFDDNDRFFSVMLKHGEAEPFQTKFKALILNEMERLPADQTAPYDPAFFNQFRVNALVGVVEWWIRSGHPLTVAEMADNTVLLFLKNK